MRGIPCANPTRIAEVSLRYDEARGTGYQITSIDRRTTRMHSVTHTFAIDMWEELHCDNRKRFPFFVVRNFAQHTHTHELWIALNLQSREARKARLSPSAAPGGVPTSRTYGVPLHRRRATRAPDGGDRSRGHTDTRHALIQKNATAELTMHLPNMPYIKLCYAELML